MFVTIDGSGRVVIPKALRDRLGLHPDTVLEVEQEADALRLRVVGQQSPLVQERGILVHHGATTIDVDLIELLRRDRKRHYALLVAERPETSSSKSTPS